MVDPLSSAGHKRGNLSIAAPACASGRVRRVPIPQAVNHSKLPAWDLSRFPFILAPSELSHAPMTRRDRVRTVIIDSPRRREQLAAVAQRLPAHVARLSWSKDQVKSERQRALRETLAFAQAKSPWHAKRLGGVDAASLTEADLACLPVMTKTDVMFSWDEVVTDRRLTLAGCNADITAKLEGKTRDYYYLDDYLVIATGGSRSEEHTSELQSLRHLVCRLLLE